MLCPPKDFLVCLQLVIDSIKFHSGPSGFGFNTKFGLLTAQVPVSCFLQRQLQKCHAPPLLIWQSDALIQNIKYNAATTVAWNATVLNSINSVGCVALLFQAECQNKYCVYSLLIAYQIQEWLVRLVVFKSLVWRVFDKFEPCWYYTASKVFSVANEEVWYASYFLMFNLISYV